MPIAVSLWYMGMDIVPALVMQAGEGGDWFGGIGIASVLGDLSWG